MIIYATRTNMKISNIMDRLAIIYNDVVSVWYIICARQLCNNLKTTIKP